MARKSKTQESRELVKGWYEAYGEVKFAVVMAPNRTWGTVAQLWVRGDLKLDFASGCGYDKMCTMVERMIRICTGDYVSLFGGCEQLRHDKPHYGKNLAADAGCTVECLGSGVNEYLFEIRKAGV